MRTQHVKDGVKVSPKSETSAGRHWVLGTVLAITTCLLLLCLYVHGGVVETRSDTTLWSQFFHYLYMASGYQTEVPRLASTC